MSYLFICFNQWLYGSVKISCSVVRSFWHYQRNKAVNACHVVPCHAMSCQVISHHIWYDVIWYGMAPQDMIPLWYISIWLSVALRHVFPSLPREVITTMVFHSLQKWHKTQQHFHDIYGFVIRRYNVKLKHFPSVKCIVCRVSYTFYF